MAGGGWGGVRRQRSSLYHNESLNEPRSCMRAEDLRTVACAKFQCLHVIFFSFFFIPISDEPRRPDSGRFSKRESKAGEAGKEGRVGGICGLDGESACAAIDTRQDYKSQSSFPVISERVDQCVPYRGILYQASKGGGGGKLGARNNLEQRENQIRLPHG